MQFVSENPMWSSAFWREALREPRTVCLRAKFLFSECRLLWLSRICRHIFVAVLHLSSDICSFLNCRYTCVSILNLSSRIHLYLFFAVCLSVSWIRYRKCVSLSEICRVCRYCEIVARHSSLSRICRARLSSQLLYVLSFTKYSDESV